MLDARSRWSRGRHVYAAVAVLLLACGCGAVDAVEPADAAPAGAMSRAGDVSLDLPTDPPPSTDGQARTALAQWRQFPVDAERRPVVLVGAIAYLGDDVYRRTALRFSDPAQVPDSEAEADGYPLIGAREALQLLREPAAAADLARRVEVSGMELGTGRFFIDRGFQDLPAWIVTFAGAVEPATVLAVAPSAQYPPHPVAEAQRGLRVSDDGRMLFVPVRLGSSGPCQLLYRAEVVETRTALTYVLTSRQTDRRAQCQDAPVGRSGGVAEVELASPLGHRVVVSRDRGAPEAVVPCGQETPDVPVCGARADDEGAMLALRRWSDFPVDADPRPIVLLDDYGGATFPTDEEMEAFHTWRWNVPKRLPDAPAEIDGYPVISAAEALTDARRGRPINTAPGRRVTLTDMRLGSAEFRTDRGDRTLPAWFISFGGQTYGSTVIPAVAAPARYAWQSNYGGSSEKVRVSPDGRSLTLRFTGAATGSGPCTADYTMEVVESQQAVAVSYVRVPRPSDKATVCVNKGYDRTVTGTLSAPLGNRVVIRPDWATAIEVRGAPKSRRP